jgi:hypothetical protein
MPKQDEDDKNSICSAEEEVEVSFEHAANVTIVAIINNCFMFL